MTPLRCSHDGCRRLHPKDFGRRRWLCHEHDGRPRGPRTIAADEEVFGDLLVASDLTVLGRVELSVIDAGVITVGPKGLLRSCLLEAGVQVSNAGRIVDCSELARMR